MTSWAGPLFQKPLKDLVGPAIAGTRSINARFSLHDQRLLSELVTIPTTIAPYVVRRQRWDDP
jgi:hypothetical protein